MVHIRSRYPLSDQVLDEQAWLARLGEGRNGIFQKEVKEAIAFLQPRVGQDPQALLEDNLLLQGLTMAALLNDLHLDSPSMVAAILYPTYRQEPALVEVIEEQFSEEVNKLLQGVKKLASMHERRSLKVDMNHLRFLLMAVVEDLRVILIKLAEHTIAMRMAVRLEDETVRHQKATETLDVYAPLANRLGIGQVKWELEDLAFRCLEPDTYKTIAKLLDEKRGDREDFINQAVVQIEAALSAEHITARTTGRAKHIFSIWKKMEHKHLGYHEIYDIRAIRVIVSDIKQCYAVLGIVHGLWQHIPKEFDDYIANPKENGYQSLHTAVVGPQGKTIEVQIRTTKMHEQAELGVAAHWVYKEGDHHHPMIINKLSALRQILTWQDEMNLDTEAAETLRAELFEDRVYVFTPAGEVLKLTKGATPLDFAYSVHTEIGHRCRGAKIDGRIVPLTQALSNGDQVTILTAKMGDPSRDWLNPHLGYLKTAQARAKVQQWFKKQDRFKNAAEGRVLLEKEIKRFAGHSSFEALAQQLKFPKVDDLFMALGSGELKITQIVSALQTLEPLQNVEPVLYTNKLRPRFNAQPHSAVSVAGVGNMLCHTAKCCRPIPGDDIIGYIVAGRGVSVHRQDCQNILQAGDKNRNRLIEVSWGTETRPHYVVDIGVDAYDRQGLVRDIGAVLASDQVSIIAFKTVSDKKTNMTHLRISLEVTGLPFLERVLNHLQQLPNVVDCYRLKG